MTHPIPQRFRAQTLDLGLEVLAAVCVPHIHFVMDLPEPLDAQRLAEAVRLTMDAEPILGCAFVPRFFRPFWRRLPEDALAADRVFSTRRVGDSEREQETERFLAEPLDARDGPCLRALLMTGGAGPRLALKVHHHVADAGATKEVGYRVADIYRCLDDDPGYRPTPRLGSRSLRQVYRRFVPRGVPSLLGSILREIWRTQVPARSHIVPTGDHDEGRPSFSLLHLERDFVRRIARWGRERGATLNDTMLAALLRALAQDSDWNGSRPIRMACTVDLRRYLPDGRTGALCNLSGFMFPTLREGLGRDLADTVRRVKADVDVMKADNLGLPFNLGGHLCFGYLPPGIRVPLLRWIFQANRRRDNQAPGLTNMGPIASEPLDFGGVRPSRAHLVVPAGGHGFVLPGLSGYDGSLTFSLGFYESALKRVRVEDIYRSIEEQLSGC